MGRSWVGTQDPGAPLRQGPLATVSWDPPGSDLLLAGIDYIAIDPSPRRMGSPPLIGYRVQILPLARRPDVLVSPGVEWDPERGLMPQKTRAVFCLLVRPEVVEPLYDLTRHPRPSMPHPGHSLWLRRWWQQVAHKAVQAGGDPDEVFRRAAVCWASAVIDYDAGAEVMDDVAAWDALNAAVTPATVEAAVLAGLSATGTRHALEAPDGPARVGALAALGGLHIEAPTSAVTERLAVVGRRA